MPVPGSQASRRKMTHAQAQNLKTIEQPWWTKQAIKEQQGLLTFEQLARLHFAQKCAQPNPNPTQNPNHQANIPGLFPPTQADTQSRPQSQHKRARVESTVFGEQHSVQSECPIVVKPHSKKDVRDVAKDKRRKLKIKED